MNEDYFNNLTLKIPDEIEQSHEDPISWWVENTIQVIVDKLEDRETIDVAVMIVMTLAHNENLDRKLGAPGKDSPINWESRFKSMKG